MVRQKDQRFLIKTPLRSSVIFLSKDTGAVKQIGTAIWWSRGSKIYIRRSVLQSESEVGIILDFSIMALWKAIETYSGNIRL